MKVGSFKKSKLAVSTVPKLRKRLRPNINIPPQLAVGLAVLGQIKAIAALNPLAIANAQLAALKTEVMNQVMSRATLFINAKAPPSIYPADMATSIASAISEAQELIAEAQALAAEAEALAAEAQALADNPASALQAGGGATTTLVTIL